MLLNEIFSDTVSRPWAPRSPAAGSELARCLVSRVRGNCVEPLLRDGDLVFVDPHKPPQPGDLVSLALSERGAAAQNDSLPPGQLPPRAGDRWIKLYTRYAGFDFLLDRHGGSATATLMACEHPEDTPTLWPVRNIQRGKFGAPRTTR